MQLIRQQELGRLTCKLSSVSSAALGCVSMHEMHTRSKKLDTGTVQAYMYLSNNATDPHGCHIDVNMVHTQNIFVPVEIVPKDGASLTVAQTSGLLDGGWPTS